jgi:hypothetical protein
MNDLRIGLDAFAAIMVTEVVVKPVAVRIGRHLLAQADHRWRWIPDWLHRSDQV